MAEGERIKRVIDDDADLTFKGGSLEFRMKDWIELKANNNIENEVKLLLNGGTVRQRMLLKELNAIKWSKAT